MKYNYLKQIVLVLNVGLSMLFIRCSDDEAINTQPYVDEIRCESHSDFDNIFGVVSINCDKGEGVIFSATGRDAEDDAMTYHWECDAGHFEYGNSGSTVTWIAPNQTYNCGNTDWSGFDTKQRVTIMVYVKDEKHTELLEESSKFAWAFVDCRNIEPPVLSSAPSVFLNGKTTSTLSYTIDTDNDSEITEAGICYNQTGTPDLNDEQKKDDDAEVGSNLVGLYGLSPNTKYYARAYATNEAGTTFSPQMYFTTDKNCNTPSVSVIGTGLYTIDCDANKYIKAKIENYSSENIIQAGVVWSSTNRTPSLDDSDYSVYTGTFSSDGEFEPTLTNLQPNTRYNFRVYAKNDCGVAYGENYYFELGDFDPEDCNGGGGGGSNDDCTFVSGIINGGYSTDVKGVYVDESNCNVRLEVDWHKETAGDYGHWKFRFYNHSSHPITVWYSARVVDGNEVDDHANYSNPVPLQPGDYHWNYFYLENSGTLEFYDIRIETHNSSKNSKGEEQPRVDAFYLDCE